MVFPVNMKASKLSHHYWRGKYCWIGACTSFYYQTFSKILIQNMYKIITGRDADLINLQIWISIYQYSTNTNTWNVLDECYAYLLKNQLLPDGTIVCGWFNNATPCIRGRSRQFTSSDSFWWCWWLIKMQNLMLRWLWL